MQHAVNYPQLENKLDSNIRNYEESKLFICQKSVEYMMSLKWKVEFGKYIYILYIARVIAIIEANEQLKLRYQ